jgi:hypothetical protein
VRDGDPDRLKERAAEKHASRWQKGQSEIDEFIVLLRSQLIGDKAQVIEGNALPCPVQR